MRALKILLAALLGVALLLAVAAGVHYRLFE
ncbi:MAG TPA: DNA-binding protein, partial [Pseudomonas sp.]|nr:DNA-binding protein [Pseudomonas sp.]